MSSQQQQQQQQVNKLIHTQLLLLAAVVECEWTSCFFPFHSTLDCNSFMFVLWMIIWQQQCPSLPSQLHSQREYERSKFVSRPSSKTSSIRRRHASCLQPERELLLLLIMSLCRLSFRKGKGKRKSITNAIHKWFS